MTTRNKKPAKITAKTPKSKGGPDWNAGRSLGFTGNIKVPPYDERIFRFPNDKGVRRDLNVEILSWRGISLGASHFYARIELERNQIWDPEGLRWFSPDHMPECKEIFYRAHVQDRNQAIEFIRLVLEAFYKDQKVYRWVLRHGLYDDEDGEDLTWEKVKRSLQRE